MQSIEDVYERFETIDKFFQHLQTAGKVQQLSKEDTQTLAQLYLAEMQAKDKSKWIDVDRLNDKDDKEYQDRVKDSTMQLLISIFHTRARMFSIDYDNGPIKISVMAMIALATITKGNPGNCVMYMAYILQWSRVNNQSNIECGILFQQIFPNGFFVEDSLSEAWSGQKIKGSQGNYVNAVDTLNFYS